MNTTPLKSEIERACKVRADELQAEALARGDKLQRAKALEMAAHECGYQNWNAALAAGKNALAPTAGQNHAQSQNQAQAQLQAFDWRDLRKPVPRPPLSIRMANSMFYRSIEELMRWANALEQIGTQWAEDQRLDALHLLGSDVPYVFVSDSGRWGDDVYRLCDRGYEPWPGIAFTADELHAAGVDTWQARYGDHSSTDMLTVGGDELIYTRDAERLRGLARVLAAIAVVADRAFERQDGQPLPQGIGFTIDLADPKQLTEKAVARLLASRDDRAHRQLRVNTAGKAFLSSAVGTHQLQDLAFQLETWTAGNGYVGLGAAADKAWITTVYSQLKSNWPTPKSRYIDF